MRKIILAILLLAFALPAHAHTGRVLFIIPDKLANPNTYGYKVNNAIYRVQMVQGWTHETCMASDSSFIGSLYQTNPCVGSGDTIAGGVKLGSRYGRYDMAVVLDMPNPYWLDTDAKCLTQGMPHFAQMIDRNATWKFPIPLLVPIADAGMVHSNKMALAYTGITEVTAYTSGKGEPYKDAQGDSLYLYTNTGLEEALVESAINSDTITYSWVEPLVWRYTPAREATKSRYAQMWMTVGAGNHRVIWLPNAGVDKALSSLIFAFSMFTHAQPIEFAALAYSFGISTLGHETTGADTLQYDAGFRRNVEYAVANGIKLDLLCYPYFMQTQNVATNKTQALAYQARYPANVRLTMSAAYPWGSSVDGWITGGEYSHKVAHIKQVQDSTLKYFPTISQARIDAYSGNFSTTPDSSLRALVVRGVTDVYNWGSSNFGEEYPYSNTYHIVGPRRMWIAGEELRTHSISYIMRYELEVGIYNNPDWLKTTYVDTAGMSGASVNRAKVAARLLPYTIGTYRMVSGTALSVNSNTKAESDRVAMLGNYQVGIYLPAFTFCGGAKLSWWHGDQAHKDAMASRRAQVDSTRSIFLDEMKQMNAFKRMGDYIVATYGNTGQSPIIWAWLDEVKWDRKNGRQFPNGHVKVE